jgi:hypothetical protein
LNKIAKRFLLLFFFVSAAMSLTAQEIPAQLRGRWVVKRELPTSTICCWGEKEAQDLIGTEIEYTADSFRWKNTVTPHPTVQVTVLSAQQFHDRYSGGGANDSQVNFRQLGIRAPQATLVILGHEPADLTGATIEIPGDEVLIKDKNTIVFSVCNVYFEAKRQLDSNATETRPTKGR